MSDQKTIQNRIEKNFKHRLKWAKREKIEAFRIYERDIPEFPFIVDIYKDHVVVYERFNEEIDIHKGHHLEYMISAIKCVIQEDESKIVLKARLRQKGQNQYEKLDQKNELVIINELNAKFWVNLHDYLDTGLFLDHRPMRKLIYQISKNKRILNLFSYTGSVSVAAALGGAAHVTSVDLSSTYQEWAKKNFLLNNLSLTDHNFIVQNALEYLQKSHTQFDLIFLDPPTFSNSKKMEEDFEVEKDQIFLIQNALRLLSPNGVLYFSNNKRKFKLDESLHQICNILEITPKTIPEDFRDPKIHHCFKIEHKNK